MVCEASASIGRSAGPDGTLVKSGGSRHGGEGTGASSGQEAELEVVRRTAVARLTSPVVVIRESVGFEDGGGREAML